MQSRENHGSSYTANDIEQYKGTEAIRKRPGMYIGDTYERGLYQIVWEVFDNSVDEYLANRASEIHITLSPNNVIEIEDNGAGIPTEINTKIGRSALELVFSELHTGGKFESNVYKTSAGLHGVGAKATNAMSEYFEVISKRAHGIYSVVFNKGKLVQAVTRISDNSTGTTGTRVKFLPDYSLFQKLDYNPLKITERLRQAAYLAKGLNITFSHDNIKETFCYPEGLKEYIDELRGKKYKPLHEILYRKKVFIYKQTKEDKNMETEVTVEFALQYNDSFRNNRVLYYTNNLRNESGGSHEIGFLEGLVKKFNSFAVEKKLLKSDKDGITKEDVKEGLIGVVSIRHTNPQFSGQTKDKLNNIEVRQFTRVLVQEVVERFLEENPEDAKVIINKILLSRKTRIDQQNAIAQIRKKDYQINQKLSEKLASCITKNSEEAELYIVEGNSAGGSAKMGRDRQFQAILPLKGKVINAEKNAPAMVLRNEEINTLIAAIGTGVGIDFAIDKVKYYKVIIMTDADVDGAHIRVLLLTFFYRYMRELIEKGFVYIAQSPLYKIEQGRKTFYFYSDDTKDAFLKKIENIDRIRVQRYKGLGEMNPQQLWETTMDPSQRTMHQVQIHDAEEADRIFTVLMGAEVEQRNEYIKAHAAEVTNLDV